MSTVLRDYVQAVCAVPCASVLSFRSPRVSTPSKTMLVNLLYNVSAWSAMILDNGCYLDSMEWDTVVAKNSTVSTVKLQVITVIATI